MITAYPFPECSSSKLYSRTGLVDLRIDWDDRLWRFALQCFGSLDVCLVMDFGLVSLQQDLQLMREDLDADPLNQTG
jgi:hypothetical protein